MLKKFLPIFLLILISINFLIPQFSFAQYGLEQGEKIQGLSKSDPEIFVGNIIKAVLLIIGVILIALIIYGGITYATSAGNEQKLETAKKILTYAIIGVAIIALAYAITFFVLNALFPEEEQQKQQTDICTCANGEQISNVSASNFNECYKACIDKGGSKGFLEKYGQEYTLQPPTAEESCKQEGEKCLFSPDVEIKDGVLYVQGTAIANPCYSGLDCDIESQECIQKCAGNGESYVRERVKREYISCCTGLVRNPDPDLQTCVRPKL